MMGFACLAFGWTPAQFLNSTQHEFYSCLEVWREMNPPAET